MTKENPRRWVEEGVAPELARVLESKLLDQPSAAHVAAFQARLGEALAAQTPEQALEAAATPSPARRALRAALGPKAALLGTLLVAVGVSVYLVQRPNVAYEGTAERRVPVDGHQALKVPEASEPNGTLPTPIMAPPSMPERAPSPHVNKQRAKRRVAKIMEDDAPVVPAPQVSGRSQLEREVALLRRIRAALADNPCQVDALLKDYRVSFPEPLLGPERDHAELLAQKRAADSQCSKRE